MKNVPTNILVIRSSAMGDVAMTAPVLAEVARRYPQTKMVLLTREFFQPFFDHLTGLQFHPVDLADYHRGWKGLKRLWRELRAAHPDIDGIIDLQDKIYSKLLRKAYAWHGVRTWSIDKGRSEKKALTAQPGKGKVLKQLRTSVERYADVFRAAGFELPPISTDLSSYRQQRPVPAGLGRVKAPGEHWVGIAPFAQHKGKVYPMEKMRIVARMLIDRDPSVTIFLFGGGNEEKQLADEAAGEAPAGRCVSVVGRFSLREEIDLIANLDLMVSMDSSAMHMSSLVGVPVVSVWGATHPYAGFLGLGQSVEDAVQLDMPCRPCSVYGHKECWRGDYACLNDLKPEVILERVMSHLR